MTIGDIEYEDPTNSELEDTAFYAILEAKYSDHGHYYVPSSPSFMPWTRKRAKMKEEAQAAASEAATQASGPKTPLPAPLFNSSTTSPSLRAKSRFQSVEC
jgi:hypothetical protein